MRFVSRGLVFDLVAGALAALVVTVSTGTTRTVAAFLLVMCVLWVPFDLVTERRRPD